MEKDHESEVKKLKRKIQRLKEDLKVMDEVMKKIDSLRDEAIAHQQYKKEDIYRKLLRVLNVWKAMKEVAIEEKEQELRQLQQQK